jgi:hypothetical protein
VTTAIAVPTNQPGATTAAQPIGLSRVRREGTYSAAGRPSSVSLAVGVLAVEFML